MIYICAALRVPIPMKLNLAKKPRSFRRLNHAELKLLIAPSGQTTPAPAAHLLARGRNFSSVPFSRGKVFYPYFLEIRAL
jgi:hypothetical protein